MNIAIVILAAGAARRFGSAKLLTPIDGVPLARRAALAALDVAKQVVVVTGAHREPVEACIADLAVTLAFNADWQKGMGSSIARGVAVLRDCDAAIIALADQPLIGSAEFAALIGAHARTPERIVAAQFDGVLGPPCLFPRAFFGELRALCGEHGARSLLQQHASRVEAMVMSDAAVDIDTPQDRARFEQQS